MMPKVSIVIPFYNDSYIDQAITSALAQTYPNVEIIVVDDGSTQYAEKIAPFTGQSREVHYLGKANGGTASALNHGIRMASGQYIAWLSSDDLFYPHKLMMQMHYMLAAKAKISFTAFDMIDEHNRITQSGVAGRYPTVQAFYRAMLTTNPINGCTVIASRDLYLRMGLFNEGLTYTHDYDLWLRIILARHDVVFLDQALIKYRWHSQMGTVKYRPAIDNEIRMVQNAYTPAMLSYLSELGG